jgi:hypothetical protein
MGHIVVAGRQACLHEFCPRCGQPMRFDHALELQPDGTVVLRKMLFAEGLRLHLRLACPAEPE